MKILTAMPVTQDSVHRGRLVGTFQDSWFSFFDANLAWVCWSIETTG